MWKKKISKFPGGIHPTDGYDKLMTMNLPVQEYWPKTVTILSEQSFGGTCRLLVKPKDKVKAGDLIGTAEAFMAAPLHASVTGEVLEVKEVANQGRKILACIVEREENQKSADAKKAYETEFVDMDGISREEILEGIRSGGLTGMGGAGFPTHKKYETDKEISTLLINGVECEPFLTCDYRLMLEKSFALLNGVALLFKASGAKEAVICIEDNKPEAIRILKELLVQAGTMSNIKGFQNIRVEELPTKYPQGGERQLIQGVLKREVPAGGASCRCRGNCF